MESLSLILIQARDSLTPENWRKGFYFQEDNGTLCMCAHGAVQAIANPQCRLAINTVSWDALLASPAPAFLAATPTEAADAAAPRPAGSPALVAASAAAMVTEPTAAARGAAAASAARSSWGQKNDWNNRPDWVKRERIINNKNYGNLDTSYLLGMVGLTAGFNDDPDTTYEMVIEKFNKAIELAKKLEQ